MKHVKKLSFLLIAAILLMACLHVLPSKAQAATYGNLTYSIENGQVTITDCT